jgi:hypothetical protein
MQDPDPPDQPGTPGWKPTTSTWAGAAVGTAFAQLITAGIETYFNHSVTSATGGAITTICIFIVSYIFPDGGRK